MQQLLECDALHCTKTCHRLCAGPMGLPGGLVMACGGGEEEGDAEAVWLCVPCAGWRSNDRET